MKRVLVTGATGFVGSHVCRELAAEGYAVRALHRGTSDLSALDGVKVEPFCGDVTDQASMLAACEDVWAVLHIAALFRQAKFPDSVYYAVNVEGTRNVFESAIAQGVSRVIHCSTVGVHSHIPHPPAGENEPYRPGDIYQVTKCQGEQAALNYFSERKISGVVIRPAMIWGPADKRTLKIFKGVARHRFPLIGSGETKLHWVLVTDLARAFRLALEQVEISNEVFIIAGERAVDLRYMLECIAAAVGSRPPSIRIPAWPVQLIGSVVEALCVPLGIEPPIYRRRVDFYTKTRSFDWTKAKNQLGYAPEHTFEAEVRLIADWYRSQGWL